MEVWTVQRLLNWTTEYLAKKGIDSPRLSAELLLGAVLGMKRIELYTRFDEVVDEDKRGRLRELVKRAGEHEPVAYLVGRTEFYSLEFEISRECMIPRPETELLVERAIEFLRGRDGEQYVCDLCTGCGCIAAAIAKNFTLCKIIATDISDAALEAASRNVAKHRIEGRVKLLRGDLFDAIVPELDVVRFDLVVCNPPYVSAGEIEMLEKSVRDYEPREAIYGGADGLDVYRRIIGRVSDFLKADGAIMLEIGYAQGQAVRGLLEESGVFEEIRIEKDLSNNDRIATAKKIKGMFRRQ
jgi:release factor glutamine methyltransferase